MNVVILKGNLTKDPEIRQAGQEIVANFCVAVKRRFSKEDRSDFINCIAWGKLADFISKYFTKGQEILVSGEIQTRTYDDKNGKKQYVTEVLVTNAEFCGSKKDKSDKADPSKTEAGYNDGIEDEFYPAEDGNTVPF